MRKLLLSLFGIMVCSFMGAQSLAFHEDFELPSGADSVTAYSSDSGNVNTWGISTGLYAGGMRSDSAICSPFDTLSLTTNAFSTVGNAFVILEFDHICKIEIMDEAIIEVSDDNGLTWTRLDSTHYMGPSTKFGDNGNLFNVASYGSLWRSGQPQYIPNNNWWKHETFNLSALASNAANVKVRFSLIDRNGTTSFENYGWFLDNIQVAASPSELVPPDITWGQFVTDTISSSSAQTITAEITDNSGIDTAYVVYYLNGILTDTLGMTNFMADSFTVDIPFMGYGRTITYFIEAVDLAAIPNTATTNNKWYHLKYQPGSLSSIEFSEDFNGGSIPAAWSVANMWQHNTGSTSSSSTGPSGPHEGTGYVYMETSTSHPATGTLTSPPFDISSVSQPYLTFYYHMYGATMGTLAVDVYDGSTWHNSVWSISGQQHSSETDPYSNAMVDLTPYKSPNTQIRFTGTTTTSYTSDMAIDDVQVGETQMPLPDAGVVELTEPTGGVLAGSNFDVKAKVKNYGGVDLTTLEVNWELDGTAQTTYNLTNTLPSGATSAELTLGSQNVSAGPHSLKLWTSNPNDTMDFNVSNDTLVFDFYGCTSLLNGTYTIGGSNPDYATFSDAVLALNQCGIDGAVTFNVAPGTYTEQFSINDISGASATNTVTFQSTSSDSTAVTVQYDATSGSDNYVVELNGAGYVSFDGMTFKAQDNTYPRVVLLQQGAHDLSFTNNRFIGKAIDGGGGTDSALVVATDSIGDNFTFTHNRLEEGSRGLDISGNDISNVVVEHNEFINQWEAVATVEGAVSPSVKYNHVNTNSTHSSFNGLQITNATNGFELAYNEVYADTTFVGYGLLLNTSSGTSSNPGMVYNNMVLVSGAMGTTDLSAGILHYESTNINYYYNTVKMVGSDQNSPALCLYDASGGVSSDIDIKNNIFTNFADGYVFFSQNVDETAFSNNYNDWYADGSGDFISLDGTVITDLAGWQSATSDGANSENLDPYFLGGLDIHTNNNLLNNSGTPIAGITDDIDGDARDANNPDMGADEFDASQYDVAVIGVVSPQTGCGLTSSENVTIEIKNVGSLAVSSMSVTYDIVSTPSAAVTENISTTINPGDTLTYTFSQTVDLDMSALMLDSTFDFKAWVDYTNDPIPNNDSISWSVNSKYQPPAPITSDTTIVSGDSVTLTAVSNDTLFWYASDTASTELETGKFFTTPPLFDTTTYWVAAGGSGGADIPELLYYKFDAPGSSVANHATSPVGNNPATINGSSLSVGGSGVSKTALVGTGGSSSSNYVSTGWNTSLSGSWTIAFWTSDIPSSSTLYYIWGDNSASSFRCFTNGAAGSGNWLVRGGGLPDIEVTGAATMNPNMIHVTYDAQTGDYKAYVDGVLVSTESAPTNNTMSGSEFKIGGYSSNTGLDGLMDEFRIYNRALDIQEIQSTLITIGSGSSCESARAPLTVNVITITDEAQAVNVSTNSGCNLGMEPVTIDIFNAGTDTIDGGLTAAYKVDDNAYISPETVNLTIAPYDTVPYTFNTLADLSGTTTGNDTSYFITAYVNLVGDTLNHNDTVVGDTIESLFTPPAPVTSDTTIFYGDSVTLTALSNDTLYWFVSDTAVSELSAGKYFTTPPLYDTTTYWVESRAGSGILAITEVTQYHGSGTGATSPAPAWLDGDDFVEITNLGSAPIDLDGYTHHREGSGAFTYNLPDISLDAGEVLVLATYGGSADDPSNNFYIAASSSTASSSATGHWLTDPNGDIVDAVALNGHTFTSASGVTSADWSGNIPSSSGHAGVHRDVYDSNTANDWTISTATEPQTLGTINPLLGNMSGGSGCASDRIPLTVSVSIPMDNAGITEIIDPTGSIQSNTPEAVRVELTNGGQNTLTSADITWELDGVVQDTISWTGNLSSLDKDTVLLDSFSFASGPHTIKAWSSMPNNLVDTVNHDDTSSVTFGACMDGTFTIGNTATGTYDFNSFNEALTAMHLSTVCGDVTFLVDSGLYNEQLIITPIPGVGSNSTVTFTSMSGDSTDVVIEASPSSGSEGVITLDEADYITFSHMTIKASSSGTYGRIIYLDNEADYNKFMNCVIETRVSTSNNDVPIYSTGSLDNYNEFHNNHLLNGYYGVYWRGSGTSALKKGSVFKGNIIENYYYYGMYLYYHDSLIVDGNKVYNRPNSSTNYAIYVYYPFNKFEIANNEIIIDDPTDSGTKYGLRMYYGNHYNYVSSSDTTGFVYNNMISMNSNGSKYGIYSYYNNNVEFYYNTVKLSGGGTIVRSLYQSNTTSSTIGETFVNNILIDSVGNYSAYFNTPATLNAVDYNVYYSVGLNLAYWSGNQITLSDLQTASGKNNNSIEMMPAFVSQYDLHLADRVLSGQGTPVSFVTEDIDGEPRSTVMPTIGADELELLPIDIGVIDILNVPATMNENDNVVPEVVVVNAGTDTIANYTVEYTAGGGTPVTFNVVNDTILPYGGTDTLTLASYNSPAGQHQLCAYTVLAADTNPFNDEYCQDIFATPTVDGEVTEVFPLASGCGLSTDTVAMTIKNIGVDTINPPFPAKYLVDGITLVEDTVNSTILPGDSIYFEFTQEVDLSTTTFDSTYNIAAWIEVPNDNVTYNDTGYVSTESQFVPAVPTVNDVTISYGNNVDLIAQQNSNAMVNWYENDTIAAPFHTGDTLTTPTLFSDTTYWYNAQNGISGSPIIISEISSNPDFVELTNVSDQPFDATGWKVITNDNNTSISQAFTDIWTLGSYATGNGQFAAQEVKVGDEYAHFAGNLYWVSSSNMWAMLVDDQGNIRDIVIRGFSASEIQTMSVDAGGFTNLNPVASGEWSGGSVATGDNFTYRNTYDSNDATDWVTMSSGSEGTFNPGMTALPTFSLAGCSSPRDSVNVFVVQASDNASAVDVTSNSGCGLSMEPVTVTIVNNGTDTIDGGLTASYKVNNGSYISPENVNQVIPPSDTATYTFNTLADLTNTTSSDLGFVITSYVDLVGDTLNAKDTTRSDTVWSLYVPPPPNVSDTTIFYADSVLLTAISNDTIYWFANDTTSTILKTGATLQTPILYDTTTYWVEARAGSGVLALTEVTQYHGSGTGATSPAPSWLDGDDFVEITNLGSAPLNLDGYTYYREGSSSSYDITYDLPDIILGAGEVLVMATYGASADDPSNNFYVAGSNSVSSSTSTGHYITDPSGSIIDAVALNGYTFSSASGVTSADWSGNIPSSSGHAGVHRDVYDNNTAGDWTISTTTEPQTLGTINPLLTNVTAGSGCSSPRVPLTVNVEIPPVNAQAEEVVTNSGCDLGMEPVTITIVNGGSNTINSGLTASYKIDDNPYITPETVNQVIAPFDTTTYTFNTLADLSGIMTGDTSYIVTAYVNIAGDALPNNDTTMTDTIWSLYTPPAPIANDTTGVYGDVMTITAQSSDTLYWWENDSTQTFLDFGQYYTTPVLYDTTTYYVSAKAGAGLSDTIGLGSQSQNYIPAYGFYDYGWSAMIIDASEIASAGTIDTLLYDIYNSPNYTLYNQTYYMTHTTNSTFSSANKPDPSTMTQVYTGDITYSGSGWHAIPLDNSFTYNGQDNLLIYVENRDGDYSSGYPQWTSSNVTSGKVIYDYQDGSFPTGAGHTYSERPNVRFAGTAAGCESPRVPLTVNIDIPDANAELTDIIVKEGCNLHVDEPVSIEIANLGGQPIDGNITASYRVNGGPYITPENVTTVINSMDTGIYTFNTTHNMLAPAGDTTFFIEAYVDLTGDTIPHNDSLATDTFLSAFTPPAPIVSDTTINFGTFANLTASSPAKVKWYASDTSTTVLDTGSVFITPILYDTTQFWASSGGTGAPASLSTTWAAGNGQDGNMFDVTAINEVLIDSFACHVDGTSQTAIEVYYKQGTYDGFESDQNAWTLLGTATVQGQGSGNPTIAPIGGLTIPPGQTYGLYVTTTGTGPSFDYTNGDGTNQYFTDGSIEIDLGVGNSYPFGSTYDPRIWNGTIYYTDGGSGCESDKVPVNVNVTGQPDIDGQLLSIDEPSTGPLKSSAEPVIFRVKNNGLQSFNSVDLTYEFDNQPAVTETVNTTMNPGDTLVHTFSSTVNMAQFRSYPIKAYLTLSGDTVNLNDTIVKSVKNKLDYCISKADNSNYGFIEALSFAGINTVDANDATYTDYTKTVAPGVLYPGVAHPFSATWGSASSTYYTNSLKVFIDINRDGVFDEATETFMEQTISSASIPAFTGNIQLPSNATPGLTMMRVVLQETSSLANVHPCGTYTYGETEDYLVQITPLIPQDAGITAILKPNKFNVSANQQFTAVVRNFGSDTIHSVDIQYTLGSTTDIHTYNTPIPPQEVDTVGITVLTLPFGNHNLCAHTVLQGDSNTFNDGICKNIYRLYTAQPPYIDNFEGADYFMRDTTSGKGTQWELGLPMGKNINSCHSGSKAWMVDLDSKYLDAFTDILYTPKFAITSKGVDSLVFWHYYDTESGDGCYVRYLNVSGHWTTLGKVNDTSAINWYTDTVVGQPGFSGNSGGWVRSSICIDSAHVPNMASITQFSFVFSSDASGNNGDGWAIDDIWVKIPRSQYDGGVRQILTPVDTTTVGDQVTVSCRIKNYGYDPLSSIPVSYKVGNNTPVTETWTGNLGTDDVTTFTFNTPYTGPGTNYELCVYTEHPQDGDLSNDEKCRFIYRKAPALDAGVVDLAPMVDYNGATDTILPNNVTIFNQPVKIKVWITNYGSSDLTTMDIDYKPGTLPGVTETWTGTLSPADTMEYTFTQSYNSGIGNYNTCAKTILAGDADASNDEICEPFEGKVSVESRELPGFILHQNIPNPATGETRIDFEVPYGGEARLIVRDMFGRELVDKEMSVITGRHNVNLDIGKWTAGIYYYSVEFDGYRLVKKLVKTR